ncbi:MAG: helix-turn-helix domain-containing protein [Candidatus Scalindua sp.]|jgi:excisionase family DNA binding protein|nr:helix-turn-helix domain-containing protein [Candidatus Scalindua sp.]
MDNPNLIKSNPVKRYVAVKELSIYTSLPVKTLYEWSSTGRIPSIKIGRRVLFDLHDIDKVMAGLKRSYNQCEDIANKIIGGFHSNGI